MEAVLSDKECGYYMKLITFILGIGMDVLHTYFEQNILNAKEHLEFYMFLDKNKHNLYHECYPKVKCCECSQNGPGMASQKGCLTKVQFMLLFEIGPLTEIDHYQTGRRINEITKQCLCRIIAKRSNDVDCMDITLMYAIIQSCYLKHNIAIHGNPRCIEAIKDTRNFLAHVPNPRISKSEFDTRFTETEQAILEIGSSLGKYFTKVNQKNIDEFKRNDLSIEGIKEIIENNIDEIIKKKLQTFIEDQRTNEVIKDEISEQFAKYKDEMVIEIRNLIFEVASCSIEKTFDSSVPQKIDTACSVNVEETEDSRNVKKRRVEWKLVTPSTWNLPGIKDTLKKCSAQLRQWFEIENVFVGSLVIQTLVQQSVLDNREEFRASVHLFLKKFVEVCRINADVPTVVKVALIIELDEFEIEETEEQPSNKEMNKIEKTTCTAIADNTSFDCQNCRQKDEIIASLKEELSEIEKDPPKIKPESTAVQQDIGDNLRANKAQVATGVLDTSTKEMMKRPRCGVKDDMQGTSDNAKRKKRYALHDRKQRKMSVYRLLRQDEDYRNGLCAKDTASPVSVFDHVIKGSFGPMSKYISTCGDQKALQDDFVSKSARPGIVVGINTDMLQPDQIIDLRQQFQRDPFIPLDADQESINKFNNYANKFEEVLLVGYIPVNCIGPA